MTTTTTRSSGFVVSYGPYAANHECHDLVSTPATTWAVPVLPAMSTAFVVMTGAAVPFVMTPRMACCTVWKLCRLTGDSCRTSGFGSEMTWPVLGSIGLQQEWVRFQTTPSFTTIAIMSASCSGVIVTSPWPMEMFSVSPPTHWRVLHLFLPLRGREEPAVSPGRSIPVREPTPKSRAYARILSGPSRLPMVQK